MDTASADRLDRFGWRAFFLSFLTLFFGPFLVEAVLLFAVPAAYYALQTFRLSRELGVRPNGWGRVGMVAAPLLILWIGGDIVTRFV